MRLYRHLVALFLATALFAGRSVDAHAEGMPSYKVVEELLRLDEGHPTAVASSPVQADQIYVGTSEGEIYASSDGASTWHHASLAPGSFATPGRSHRWNYDRWTAVIGGMPLLTAVGYPHIHGTINLFLLDRLFAPRGFDIDELNPNPALYRRMPRDMRQLGRDRPQIGPETHYHEIFLGVGGDVDGFYKVAIETGLPTRLRSALLEADSAWQPTIHGLVADPRRAEAALAATDAGLFRTEDGGLSWHPFGDLPPDTAVHDVTYDSQVPGRWYACSDHGLFEGDLEGVTRPFEAELGGDDCRFAAAVGDGRTSVWALSGRKLWKLDGGAGRPIDVGDYDIGEVKSISVSAGPADRLLIAGEHALLMSDDGGQSLQRIRVGAVGRQPIRDAVQAPGPDHLVLATRRDLWESRDGGLTWHVVAFGHRGQELRGLARPRGAEESIWLLAESALLRVQERYPHQMPRDRWSRVSDQIADEPSMTAVIDEGLRSHELLPMPHLTRDSANWSNALPFFHVIGGYREIAVPRVEFSSLAFGPDMPRAFASAGIIGEWHVMAFITWKFNEVIYDGDARLIGPEVETSKELARSLRDRLADLYVERRRLQLQAAAEGDGVDLRSTVLRETRIEELTAHIDALTDGVFQRNRPAEVSGGVP